MAARNSTLSDEQIIELLYAIDNKHLAAGMEPSAREFLNVAKALEALGEDGAILSGPWISPLADRMQRISAAFFTPTERLAGGLHLGAFLFRDMFCRLHAPVVMGRFGVELLGLLDLNHLQKRLLVADAEAFQVFIDQATDIIDFGYGWSEFGLARQIDIRGQDLIWRAHAQLEAAAATATGAYDFRGTLQSALLGAELALKAGLAAHGMSNQELSSRRFGHNTAALAKQLASFAPKFDLERVLRVLSRFPHFVASRYEAAPPGRIETGHILMGAQYIASEVTRQFSDRDCRASVSGAAARTYPA